MNREQTRKLTKQLKNKGKTPEEIEYLISLQKLKETRMFFEEGEKVTLDVEQIKAHPDFERKVEGYKNFVLSNEGKVFTVKYDKNHQKNPLLVVLEEDPIGWLWHESELKRVKKYT